jgi:hypothetical protein
MVRRTGKRDQPRAVSGAGIREVGLRIRQSVSRQTIRLGHAKLVLEGSTGHFIFRTQK